MTSTQTSTEHTPTVLITGFTSGIGATTARTLAAHGWSVVVTGRDQAHGASTTPRLCPAVDTIGLTDSDLDATLAVNIRAPHVLTAALAPAMAERGSGAIVVIGSWMAQLARSWAAEFGPRGVRVNTGPRSATAGIWAETLRRTCWRHVQLSAGSSRGQVAA